jgi:hypothetical protein
MKFIMSLSVGRPHADASILWPHGVKQLVVLVSRAGSGKGALIACGVDAADDRIVFEAELRPAQLSRFIKAVIDGDVPAGPGDGPSPLNFDDLDGVRPNTVVVPNPSPPSTGPKASLIEIATAIGEATSAPSTRRKRLRHAGPTNGKPADRSASARPRRPARNHDRGTRHRTQQGRHT